MLFDTLVLFDLSSSFCYGRKSDLVKHGYSRDHRSDRPQIVYGLLCDREGRPVAVEVLPGNTSDPKAFTRLVDRVRKRFGIKTVVFVGDRGMITSARINEDLRDVEGFDWISALRTRGVLVALTFRSSAQKSGFQRRRQSTIGCAPKEFVSWWTPDTSRGLCSTNAIWRKSRRKTCFRVSV